MFEARRVLEVGVAGLAAERATGDQLASISEEITGMYASMDDPQAFLVHDIRFHRAVAAAAGNPILASLVEMVSEIFYEHRRKTAAQGKDLKEAADLHRTIYHALRTHDGERARRAMEAHLSLARERQATEAGFNAMRRSTPPPRPSPPSARHRVSRSPAAAGRALVPPRRRRANPRRSPRGLDLLRPA